MKTSARLKTEQIISCWARAELWSRTVHGISKSLRPNSSQVRLQWLGANSEPSSSWLLWMFRCPSDNRNDSGACLLIVFQLCPTDCIITWYFSNTVFCFCHANLKLMYFPHWLYGRFLQKWLYNYLAVPVPNNLSLTMCLRRVFGGEHCDVNSYLMRVCVTHLWSLWIVGTDVHISMRFLLSRYISSTEKSNLPPSSSMASVVV